MTCYHGETARTFGTVRIDEALVQAWRRLNLRGGIVVALRFDRAADLATALVEVESTGRRVHAMGATPAHALDLCSAQL